MSQATTTSEVGGSLDAAGLGAAIRTRREELRITQARLAAISGMPAPQTISEIENGRREVRAQELVRIARALHTDLDVLLGLRAAPSDPRVLWRRGSKPEDRAREAQLLERARRYKQLEDWCGEPAPQPLPNVQFDPRTATHRSVAALADQMRRLFDLGSIPAATLQRTLEDCYGVKIFMEPLEGDQSGACVRAAFGAAVLLNQADVPWRRNFSLAHELFHLLTWDAVEAVWNAGPHNEEDEPAWYSKLEKFANHFASHVLLPAESLLVRVQASAKDGKLSYHSVATVARDFEVSTQALLYRLCDLGQLERDHVERALKDDEFRRVSREVLKPLWRRESQWFPERYFNLAARAYQSGVIGKSIVAKYLELPYAEVETFDLGEPHGSEAALSLS